jgi:hypothetical protein
MLLRGGAPLGQGRCRGWLAAAGAVTGHMGRCRVLLGCWLAGSQAGVGHSQAGGALLQDTTARAAQPPGGGSTPAQLELGCAVVECGGSRVLGTCVLQAVCQHTLG